MNPSWLAFLQSQHAIINNGRTLNFGNADAELKHTKDGTITVDLSQLGRKLFCKDS